MDEEQIETLNDTLAEIARRMENNGNMLSKILKILEGGNSVSQPMMSVTESISPTYETNVDDNSEVAAARKLFGGPSLDLRSMLQGSNQQAGGFGIPGLSSTLDLSKAAKIC